MMAPGKRSRLRATRGRPPEPPRSKVPVAVDRKDWVYVSVPALVDAAVFRAAHAQLQQNRSRARQGRRRPGYLLQGLTCCARCGYAHYGNTLRQLRAGREIKDYIYYRCSGSDGYRFGGEAICRNNQVQGKFLETAVWREVCGLLTNPQRLEQEYLDRDRGCASLEGVETLKAQRVKLQHALERLIDSFTEGLIDKAQFTSRMGRTKNRIADLDARINVARDDVDRFEDLRLETKRLQELALAIGPDLASADWHRRREIIRTIVQRIDIDTEVIRIIFRVTLNTRVSSSNSIAVTLPRP